MNIKRKETTHGALAESMYLYDTANRKAKTLYPTWVIGLLAAIGFLAFAATGFWGYPTDDSVLYTIFHPPWALFLWFGAAILLLQLAIFKQRNLARWRWGSFSITLISIVAIAISYVRPDVLKELTDALVAIFRNLGITLGGGRIKWNLVNFGLIALYIYDRVTLWASGKRAEYVSFLDEFNPSLTGEGGRPAPPTRWELASQDLFAGAALCLVLGFVLQDVILNLVAPQLTGSRIAACDVSWIAGTCQSGGANNLPTLNSIDWRVAIFAVTASLFILGIGLIARTFFLQRDAADDTVVRGVLATIWSVINPLDVFFRNLRNVLWPIFAFAGVLAAATSARYIRLYLHALSDQRTCGGAATCSDLKEYASYLANSVDTSRFLDQAYLLEARFLALAIGTGALAVIAILLAARILVTSRIPVTPRRTGVNNSLFRNWLWFFGSIARILLISFWVLSICLSALMKALQSVNATSRVPFPQPGISTIVSFIFFLIIGIPLMWRNFRKRRQPQS
jgi:hypothetical protein